MTGGSVVVIDASALLAFLHREPGAGAVEQALDRAVISSVNWSEVARKSVEQGQPVGLLRTDLVDLGMHIEPFTTEDAELAADIYLATRPFGLSLGDRACLALAQRLGAPALTADRRWKDIQLSIQMTLIR